MSFIADAISSVVSSVSDTFSSIGNTLSNAFQGIEKIGQNIIDNPLPVIETVALTAVGVPYPIAAASVTAANGGDIKSIALSAATAYAAGSLGKYVNAEFAPGEYSQGPDGTWYDSAGTPANLTAGQQAVQGFSLATQKTIQAVVTSSSGSAAVAALSGKSFSDVLKAGATGAVSGLIADQLKAQGIVDPVNDPTTSRLITNAATSASSAIMNGKSIMDAVTNSTVATLAQTGMSTAASAIKTEYDSILKDSKTLQGIQSDFNDLKKTAADYYKDTVQTLSDAASELYDKVTGLTESITKDTATFTDIKSKYDSAVSDATTLSRNDQSTYNWIFARGYDVTKFRHIIDHNTVSYDSRGRPGPGDLGTIESVAQQYADQANSYAAQLTTLGKTINDNYTSYTDNLKSYTDTNKALSDANNTYTGYVTQLNDYVKNANDLTKNIIDASTKLGTDAAIFTNDQNSVINDAIKTASDLATKQVLDAKNAGFDNLDEYDTATKAGFTDKTTYDSATDVGFTDAKTYSDALSKGFSDAKTFSDALNKGFTDATEYKDGMAGGFTDFKTYSDAKEAGFTDAKTYSDALNKGFTDATEYKDGIKAGFTDFKTYSDAKEAGFTDATTYDDALSKGFTDAKTFNDALSKGFTDASTYDTAAKAGFTDASTYDTATKAGFEDAKTYDDAKEAGFTDAKTYSNAIAGGFTDAKTYNDAKEIGYSSLADFTKAAKDAGFEKDFGKFVDATNAGFKDAGTYNYAIDNGFKDWAEFDKASSQGFTSAQDYHEAMVGGFTDSHEFQAAKAFGITNANDWKILSPEVQNNMSALARLGNNPQQIYNALIALKDENGNSPTREDVLAVMRQYSPNFTPSNNKLGDISDQYAPGQKITLADGSIGVVNAGGKIVSQNDISGIIPTASVSPNQTIAGVWASAGQTGYWNIIDPKTGNIIGNQIVISGRQPIEGSSAGTYVVNENGNYLQVSDHIDPNISPNDTTDLEKEAQYNALIASGMSPEEASQYSQYTPPNIGDSGYSAIGDSGYSAIGDSGYSAIGDSGYSAIGDSGYSAIGDSGYSAIGDSGYSAIGDSGYSAIGDSGYSAIGDSGYSAIGDSGYSAIGDSGYSAIGDSGYSAIGDSGYSAIGDSGYSAIGDSGYSAIGDSGYSAIGDSGYSAIGDSGYSDSGYNGSGYNGSGDSGYSGSGYSGSGDSGYSGSGDSGYSGSGYSGSGDFGYSGTSGRSSITGTSGRSSITGFSGRSGASGINSNFSTIPYSDPRFTLPPIKRQFDTALGTLWDPAGHLKAQNSILSEKMNPYANFDIMSQEITDPQLALNLNMAQGGLTAAFATGGSTSAEPPHIPEFYSEGGMKHAYVRGDGDGTSDEVKAMLARGEFVIPADVVSNLGNGDNEAGAEVLDKFLQAVREHKRSTAPDKLPPDSKGPLTYLSEAYKKVKES